MNYRDGAVELESGTVVLRRPDAEMRIALESVTRIDASLEPSGAALLRITTPNGVWDCPDCRPADEVDAFLKAVQTERPQVEIGWVPVLAAAPPILPSPLLLNTAMDKYFQQGYGIVQQEPTHAVMVKPKKLNIPAVLFVLIAGLLFAEIPLAAYLFYYFIIQKAKVVELTLAPDGRVVETFYNEGERPPLRTA